MWLRTNVLPAAFACGVLAAGGAHANPERLRAQSNAEAYARHQALAQAEARAQAVAQAHAQAYWQAQARASAYAQMRQGAAPTALYNAPPGANEDVAPRAWRGAAQPGVVVRPLTAPRGHTLANAPPTQGARAMANQQMAALTPATDPLNQRVDPQYQRAVVPYTGKHPPGTIIVDTPSRYLYLVQPGQKAIRYGIGVGRPGFEWAGVKRVTRKAEWPDWTPPAEMLKRRPDLPRFMKGGVDNPLGARALYLGSSLYRIHGTNEPWTIGQNVSSGCIRMMNDDVIDLYSRVRVGTRVIVI